MPPLDQVGIFLNLRPRGVQLGVIVSTMRLHLIERVTQRVVPIEVVSRIAGISENRGRH